MRKSTLLMLFIYFRLKTIDLVIRSTQGAEDVLRKYENQLRDVHKVPENEKELESNQAQLKVQYHYVTADRNDHLYKLKRCLREVMCLL